MLDSREGAPEDVSVGRYVLPGGELSRNPQGQPASIKCDVDTVFDAPDRQWPCGSRGRAGQPVVVPAAWMSLSGRRQATPDRNTRGWLGPDGTRHWLDVFPDISGAPRKHPALNRDESDARWRRRRASPSQLIDERIEQLGDWRGKTLARVRTIIKQADPDVVEEWKWRGVPVWEHAGIICTGETYKEVVKLTFAKGASLDDPSGLFNSSLEGNTRRAIDIREGEKINATALKALVRARLL